MVVTLMACGRLEVFDDDVIAYACTLRACGVPGPEIARKLVIPSGKNKGPNPHPRRRRALRPDILRRHRPERWVVRIASTGSSSILTPRDPE
ncbi:hypothetical protein [Nonomuraea sp. NPDC003804]|uniref:hypothetical protein n=1 Tax=Nonomuraea sp. NPDC003804 TaxID=3154547 RepID=UPI0033B74CAE